MAPWLWLQEAVPSVDMLRSMDLEAPIYFFSPPQPFPGHPGVGLQGGLQGVGSRSLESSEAFFVELAVS